MIICKQCGNIMLMTKEEKKLFDFLKNEPNKDKCFNISTTRAGTICYECKLKSYKEELAKLQNETNISNTDKYCTGRDLEMSIYALEKRLKRFPYRNVYK